MSVSQNKCQGTFYCSIHLAARFDILAAFAFECFRRAYKLLEVKCL